MKKRERERERERERDPAIFHAEANKVLPGTPERSGRSMRILLATLPRAFATRKA